MKKTITLAAILVLASLLRTSEALGQHDLAASKKVVREFGTSLPRRTLNQVGDQPASPRVASIDSAPTGPSASTTQLASPTIAAVPESTHVDSTQEQKQESSTVPTPVADTFPVTPPSQQPTQGSSEAPVGGAPVEGSPDTVKASVQAAGPEAGAAKPVSQAQAPVQDTDLHHGALAEQLIAERQHKALADAESARSLSQPPPMTGSPPPESAASPPPHAAASPPPPMDASPPPPHHPDLCTDKPPPPPNKYTCAEQKAFGKCDAKFIVDFQYCDRTCGRCTGPCTDIAPTTRYSCQEQKGFGKCDNIAMKYRGYCDVTCGRCAEGGGVYSPAAVPEASVSPPAAAIPPVAETPSTSAPPPPGGAEHNATLYQWTFTKYAADLMHLEPRQHSKAAWAHGIIMAVAWGLILPIGVLTSRYGKGFALWLHAHRAIQTAGYLTVLAGFGMAYVMHTNSGASHANHVHEGGPPAGTPGTGRRLLHEGSDPARNRVRDVHEAFAFAILALITLQVLALVIRPAKGGKGRAAWGWYHWMVGWTVLTAGTINVFQGLALLGPGRWYVLGYGLAVAGFIGILLLVEARRCIYGHELEGYKQANENGDLEMVGGNREERQGLTSSSILNNGVLHDFGDDDDDELIMTSTKFAQD